MEFAGQCGNVWTLLAFANEPPDFRLAAQTICGPAQERFDIHPFGPFQRFKLPDDSSGLSAFLESDLDSVLELVQIDGFGNAIMRAPRALQGVDLLLRFQNPGNHEDRHVRQQFLKLRAG